MLCWALCWALWIERVDPDAIVSRSPQWWEGQIRKSNLCSLVSAAWLSYLKLWEHKEGACVTRNQRLGSAAAGGILQEVAFELGPEDPLRHVNKGYRNLFKGQLVWLWIGLGEGKA